MSTARHGAQQDAGALLTITQTATRLGVSKRTIWSLISAGALSVHRIGARSVRVHPDDLAAYLDGAYTARQQLAEILDPGIVTLLFEIEDGLSAFAQLHLKGHGDGVAGDRPVELWRFYVDPAWHGKGVAGELMETVEKTVRELGADTLWLGVWEKNLRAQAFYRKCGFVEVGAHVFVVGTDPQRDVVMSKPLIDRR